MLVNVYSIDQAKALAKAVMVGGRNVNALVLAYSYGASKEVVSTCAAYPSSKLMLGMGIVQVDVNTNCLIAVPLSALSFKVYRDFLPNLTIVLTNDMPNDIYENVVGLFG